MGWNILHDMSVVPRDPACIELRFQLSEIKRKARWTCWTLHNSREQTNGESVRKKLQVPTIDEIHQHTDLIDKLNEVSKEG